jgi:hypothetical protein
MEYGKFETLEELINGYVSLEKEFTKKCQELSEIIKKQEDEERNSNIGTSENDGATITSGNNAVDCAESVLPPRGGTGDAVNPEDMPQLKTYLMQIPDELSLDEAALKEFVEKNRKLADKIFEIYLFKNSLSSAPKVIGGGGYLPTAPQTKPKNISEASNLSRHLFK